MKSTVKHVKEAPEALEASGAEPNLQHKIVEMIESVKDRNRHIENRLIIVNSQKDTWEANVSKTTDLLTNELTDRSTFETLHEQAKIHLVDMESQWVELHASKEEISSQLQQLEDAHDALTKDVRIKELSQKVQGQLQSLTGSTNLAQVQSSANSEVIETANTTDVNENEILKLLFTVQATLELSEELKGI